MTEVASTAPQIFATGMSKQKEGGKIDPSVHREKPMDEQALRKMSAEILADIKEWRQANPRAMYVRSKMRL